MKYVYVVKDSGHELRVYLKRRNALAWVKSEGFVYYKGFWVMPEDRQGISEFDITIEKKRILDK